MSENNKTYRIKANVGSGDENFINVKLDQDYDSFQILSLTLKGADTYRLHNANYGVIVGRVLANENFGVPNAKVSVFIEADTENMSLSELDLYPYTKTSTTNRKGVRYNLLPNEKIDDCHQPVGTFPTKSYLLDNDDLIEIFDGYYVYTTRTNNAGDYMICGVPTGNHELHMDLDLSDCGILSQRPRDFVYKGYTMEQFENPNMFKTGTTLSSLSQIFSQNQSVNVIPFWGNDTGEEIGITRADIFISFTFEPTCVFMGSVVTDNTSNGISKKCVPTNNMGAMDELTTGKGTIEIIRKTPGGNIEQIQVKGDQVIDGNGVWCYQIPMNLDYMMTDEYGNMVPTDDPSKGIPTRTRVRFRLALEDFGENNDNYYKSKALIPNNPPISAHGNVDYNFGSETQDESFRDLYWNNVYTIKTYIPRFQKSKNWRNERFSGIKHCNIYGNNNPIPYNNIRIRLPLMFRIMCAILKNFIRLTYLLNKLVYRLDKALTRIAGYIIVIPNKRILEMSKAFRYILIGEKLCEDLDGWYFAPGANTKLERDNPPVDIIIGAKGTNNSDDFFLLQHTYDTLQDKEEMEGMADNTSVDEQNQNDDGNDGICITTDTDYLVSCLEMQLAQEHKVIQFDFYNDWINGLIYLPNWKRIVKTKRTFMFWTWNRKKIKVKGCMNANGAGTAKSRYLVQQCALKYKGSEGKPFSEVTSTLGCSDKLSGRLLSKKVTKVIGQATIQEQKCHKATGMQRKQIFGRKNGLITEVKTMRNQYVYYLKPCEWEGDMNYGKRVLLFATDIVLLGSLNDCDDNGIPQAFKHLQSSSYKLPTNLALTTIDDDSFIYTTTGATICKKQSQTDNLNGKEGGVRRQYTTFNGTTKAYSVNSSSEQINYEAFDDPIAVTEAAGISWNYTGPGQDILGIGEQSEALFPNLNAFNAISDDLLKQKYLYYPGGHFLGLSCNNSQTNIKSCINLKRMCEVGTTMSERHEIVRGINEQNGEIQYRYLVPTGFIAQDEVNDAAFRTMFATMNHNTLLAKGVDENTGYPSYKFKFMRPNGFDGTFSKYTYLDGTPYNHVAPDVVDETSVLDKLFAINGWAKPDDYDPEESGNTETRTIEDVSKDYYMFRMGLNDLKVRNQIERFLITVGNAEGYIPQYENSFYFYFGLKDGATALDEFKRQFFSECEKRSLITGTQIKARTDIDVCNLRGTIRLTIDGMIPSYLVSIKDNKKDKFVIEEQPENKDVITYTLPIGVYTITVEDAREISKSITVDLGDSLVDVTGYDVVNYRISEHPITAVTGVSGRSGGYIAFDGIVSINGVQCEIVTPDTQMQSGRSYVELFYDDGVTSGSVLSGPVESYYDAEGIPKYRFFGTGFTVGQELSLKMNLQCYYEEHDESGNTIFTGHTTSDETYFITNFSMKDNANLDLLYGCYYWGYKNGNLTRMVKSRGDEWWNNYPGDTKEDWALKMFMFRQLVNDDIGFNSSVMGYASDGEKFLTITFGEPERYQSGYKVLKTGFSESDYDAFDGYTLNDTDSHYPTWGIINAGNVYQNSNVSSNSENGKGRIPFSKMVYTLDGRSAADALPNCTVASVTHDDVTDKNTITFSGDGLKAGQGAIVVFENGEIVFPYMTSDNSGVYYGDEPASTNGDWLKCATVYPTFRFPAMYRPFFGTVKFLTFCFPVVVVNDTFDMEAGFTMDFSQKPYFIGGELHNGVTYQDKLSQKSDETVICGYALEGKYPDGNLTPELSGREYIAQPMEGAGWTNDDANPATALTTYTSGRTLPVKVMATFNIYDGGVMDMLGFPYYNQEHTGDTYSYTFTEGYPIELFESANTEGYTGITQPYFPEVKSVSDSVEAIFVDYVVFECNSSEDRTISRLLYGNLETTEYDDGNGNFLRYYDITDSGMRYKYKSRYNGDEGASISKDAWVYTKKETGNKKRPSAAVACVCKDENMRNAAGSDIVYALVYDPKKNILMVKYPVIDSNGEISYDEAQLGSNYGELNGDIMEDLAKNENGKGLKAVYDTLGEQKLVPLRNPIPDATYGTSGITYEEFVRYAYDAFLAADANGKQVTLSNKKQFLATKPTEVLGVCKQTNGRNETYVFKYYIQVFEFGDSSTSTAAHPGREATSNVVTDTDSVSVTGSSFNVTISSDFEWILVITSTTKDGVTITCPSIGTNSINSSWYTGSTAMTESKIRDIQKAGTDEEDAALWDAQGGTHFPSGKYVFTIKMDENKGQDDVHVNLFSIPYYPYNTDVDGNSKTQNTEIVQKAREVIEFTGTCTTRKSGQKAILTYQFGCVSGEWPDELSFSVDLLCTVTRKETTTATTTGTSTIDTEVSLIDGDYDYGGLTVTGQTTIQIPDGSGGTTTVTADVTGGTEGYAWVEDTVSTTTRGTGQQTTTESIPVTLVITKTNYSGEITIANYGNATGNISSTVTINSTSVTKNNVTFSNLGDNYVGQLTLRCGSGAAETIIQPDRS